MGSGHMSHRRTPAFDDHPDHCLIVLKNVQQSVKAGKFSVRSDVIDLSQTNFFRGSVFVRPLGSLSQPLRTRTPRAKSRFGEECSTSMTKSHTSRAGMPSMRKPRPRILPLTLWSCVRLQVVFLHIQLIGTNVRLPMMHKMPTSRRCCPLTGEPTQTSKRHFLLNSVSLRQSLTQALFGFPPSIELIV